MISPTFHKISVPLLAATLLAAYTWTTDAKTLTAESAGLFNDADGDFLPDALEWVLLTDPLDADSDDDGVGDYVEMVQSGYPLVADPVPLPSDDEMRVLATTGVDETGASMLWVHVLFRLMNGLDTELEDVLPWVDLEGTKYPLENLFDGVPVFSRVLENADGMMVMISTPVASEDAARSLLPFTFGISARLGGRSITSSAYYMDLRGQTNTIVARDRDRSVMQTLRQAQQKGVLEFSDRVCALSLTIVGTTPCGPVVRIDSARCEDARRLRCPFSCSAAVETVFLLPDGLSTIAGLGGRGGVGRTVRSFAPHLRGSIAPHLRGGFRRAPCDLGFAKRGDVPARLRGR